MSGADVRRAVVAAVATMLGSVALTPVFSSAAWLPPVAAVVLAVLAAGLLLRAGASALGSSLRSALRGDRRPARPAGAPGMILVPLGQLFVLLCLLTALYAPANAFAGVLPTWTSLGELGGVLTEGMAELREQATPALPLTGLLALTTVLVGLIAVTVDLVAVDGRQPAIAGLGLLVLFCVPVSTIVGGIGLPALVAPAIGMALLLWADQHQRLDVGDSVGRRILGVGGANALRIGITALLAGLVVGAVVPTLAEGTLSTGLGGGKGSSTGTALDPAAELHGQLTREQPEDLLSVDTPSSDPGYLRSVVLDQYDVDGGWTLSNLDGEISVGDTDQLAPLQGDQPRRPITGTITVLGHDDRFMPVFTSPLAVRVLGGSSDDWRFDQPTGTVFGRRVTTAGLTYWVSAAQPRPATEALAASPPVPQNSVLFRRFTQLPELDPRVTDLVTSLTGDVGEGQPYERVRRIQEYLTDRSNGFVYSLATAPGTSGNDLVDFLRLRRGYCEQYAGAMAVMVRAAGVPARVALGYTPGEVQPDGTRLISTDDAHAWVEVYFDGVGWVPFDPTPIGAGRAADLPWAPRNSQDEQPQTGPDAPAATVPSQAAPRVAEDRGGNGVTPSATASGSTVSVRPYVLAGSGTLLAVAVLVLPAGLRGLQRRRRRADGRAGALWDELGATAADLGLRLHPAWTPRRTAEELGRGMTSSRGAPDPAAVEAVHRLALAEERSSYGPAGSGAGGPELATALRLARRALGRGCTRSTRLRATLWPASLVGGAGRRLAAGVAERLGGPVRRRRSSRETRPA
jgi:transglutaminase-like putative cysteine protease